MSIWGYFQSAYSTKPYQGVLRIGSDAGPDVKQVTIPQVLSGDSIRFTNNTAVEAKIRLSFPPGAGPSQEDTISGSGELNRNVPTISGAGNCTVDLLGRGVVAVTLYRSSLSKGLTSLYTVGKNIAEGALSAGVLGAVKGAVQGIEAVTSE